MPCRPINLDCSRIKCERRCRCDLFMSTLPWNFGSCPERRKCEGRRSTRVSLPLREVSVFTLTHGLFPTVIQQARSVCATLQEGDLNARRAKFLLLPSLVHRRASDTALGLGLFRWNPERGC